MAGRASSGGLLLDHNRSWSLGYGKFVGNCSIFVAEAWATLDGLKLAGDSGHTKLQVECDNMELVNMLEH
ncbi:hypothetical protein J1N35_044709 [Gossypium stocksii]|uniref:RNase H type-1 domain-containing protein n=1 Tax=Gossypium stocksii TaxID=47602 RepID=A0A9D3U9X0_9ROSI|nr:hypothetical protein J1N35_044709 [Gossypium stocksii]